jgi:dihydroflavonol-4-reductase
MTRPVLVTGATGFLGKHLVSQLLESGQGPLRLLSRHPTPWDNHPGVETIRGDVTSAEDVDRAAAGVREVYHLAGFVSRDPKDAVRLYDVHVAGTRHICGAALRHGVSKLVVVSSSGTVAVSKEPVIHDETSGYKNQTVAHWHYYLSKIFAEKAALAYYTRDRLPVVVVNPALILGPGDDRGSSTGDLALFLEGQILSMPPGGMSFVDARDCAAGCIGAMLRGRPGERYLLGGANWTFRRIVEAAAGLTHRRPPILEIPVPVSLALAPVLRKTMPWIGRSFKLDDATIEMSGLFWYCTSAKAERELGFRARDPLETLRDTIHELLQRQAA